MEGKIEIHDDLEIQLKRMASHLRQQAQLLEQALEHKDYFTAEFLAGVCLNDATKLSQVLGMITRGELR